MACGQEEAGGHTHTESCYEGESNLICGKEELEEHIHGDGCFSGVENGADAGSGDGDGIGNLVNGMGNPANCIGIPEDGTLAEGEPICGKEEHTHTEECYDRGIMLLAEGLIDKGDWWELDFYSPFLKLESTSEVKCAILVEKSSPNPYNTALEAWLLNQQTETFS